MLIILNKSYIAIMLETDRLYLIPFEREDLGLLHRLFTHPFIREHIWDDLEIDIKESQHFIEANEKYFQNYRWGIWKLMHKDSLEEIGFAGLWPLFEDPFPQLLYGLLPQYTKLGYATEAVKKVINFAFEELDFPYLKASMDINHDASQKLAQRVNMSKIRSGPIEGDETAVYCINAPIPHRIFNLN